MIVKSVHIYPIKSLGGVLLQSARLLDRGLEHDRRWMLVDSGGVFLTQRNLPTLALFSVQIWETQLLVHSKLNGSEVGIPFSPEGQNCKVKIWDDEVDAIEVSKQISRWFSHEIGKPVRLVYMLDSTQRLIDSTCATRSKIVSLADGYPVLVANVASLNALNLRLKNPVNMDRFRPNIVIEGERAFEEDDWKSLSIRDTQLSLVKKCARCVMVNINPKTANKETEVLSALASFRKVNNKVYFGMNALSQKNGMINIGDKVVVD